MLVSESSPQYETVFEYQQLDQNDYNVQLPPDLQRKGVSLDQAYPTNLPPAHYLTHRQPRLQHPVAASSRSQPDGRREQTVGQAFYVLGKHILGRNTTDRLLPVVSAVRAGYEHVRDGVEVLSDALSSSPAVEFDDQGVRFKTVNNKEKKETTNAKSGREDEDSAERANQARNAPRCTTPEKGAGRCMDIQNCPLLLADLDKLRKSICFKSLFVPGVCCPESG